MKYIKLFLLMALAVPFLASCSDDDDVNSTDCKVGFVNTSTDISEYVDGHYVNIPIAVTGKRNGPIHLIIKAEGTGENPAIEGENFTITDKTLTLNPDTLSSGTINVELKVIDDKVKNPDRQLTLTIVSAEGAEITSNQTVINIVNNDGYYNALFGEWKLTCSSAAYGMLNCNVTISGTTDENDPNYEKVLKVSISNMLRAGETITYDMNYSYNSLERKGSVSWPIKLNNQIIATTQDGKELFFAIDPEGTGYVKAGDLTGEWKLDDNGSTQTITFPTTPLQLICCYLDGNNLWAYDVYTNIVMTRK